MESKLYPDLEAMCRLCLKENAGTVCIFSKEKASDKYASLSVPMRIMTCAALEVQESDDFPKKICTKCRLQLEKSYYFRKLSQASDAKLRRHIRLIGMGKKSQVFNKNLEEDDDELEFQHSLDFIKEQEEQQNQIEKLKIDTFLNEMKIQNEQDLKKIRANLKTTCREELIPEIREEVRKELRTEIQNEIEEDLRREITGQCVSQAKELLRAEVREECRQLEIKCLLGDLETYLNDKKKSLDTIVPVKDIVFKSAHSLATNADPTPQKLFVDNLPKIEVVRMELDLNNSNVEKENIILTENITIEDDFNANDEECESEGNFLLYNIEDGFDDQKKSSEEDKFENVENEAEYEDDDYIGSNIETYEKNDENINVNEGSGETTTSTTSYRIEDNEDGEIQFLKKCNENTNNTIDERNPIQTNEGIMVINIAEATFNEYVEQIEEVKQEQHTKVKKESSNKIRKSAGKKSKASTVTRTTSSSSETTFLTKTYVNPLQRSTDTPKIFKCNDCPMVFSTKPSLERHLRSHRKVEKTGVTYQCPECRIVVSCSSALRRHMYVHCEEKPFACNVCDKAFVQKEILKRHMQTHTGIKPHQCPHCERSFAQRINLTQHINRTHLEVPRIQQHHCYLCSKRFNHASGLSRHLASHSGVAFQCSECDRTFGDRSSIKRHIINMHNNARASKSDVEPKK